MPRGKINTVEGFWAQVQKPSTLGLCWLWVGRVDHQGYPEYSWPKRKPIRGHRWVWEQYFGPIPSGLQVLHTCDIRNCVYPGHLFLGTQLDNMRDKVNKKRQAVGDKHGRAKMTNRQAQECLDAWRTGTISQGQLAKKYGVVQTTIGDLVNRKTWKNLS